MLDHDINELRAIEIKKLFLYLFKLFKVKIKHTLQHWAYSSQSKQVDSQTMLVWHKLHHRNRIASLQVWYTPQAQEIWCEDQPLHCSFSVLTLTITDVNFFTFTPNKLNQTKCTFINLIDSCKYMHGSNGHQPLTC